MLFKTEVKKQGNSNVIILPKRLGLKPADKVNVLLIREKASTVGDAAGLYKRQLKGVDTLRTLKAMREELWGE